MRACVRACEFARKRYGGGASRGIARALVSTRGECDRIASGVVACCRVHSEREAHARKQIARAHRRAHFFSLSLPRRVFGRGGGGCSARHRAHTHSLGVEVASHVAELEPRRFGRHVPAVSVLVHPRSRRSDGRATKEWREGHDADRRVPRKKACVAHAFLMEIHFCKGVHLLHLDEVVSLLCIFLFDHGIERLSV